MKKTATRIELIQSASFPGKYETIPHEKITCKVVGEMDTGTKIWADVKTGEQFFLMRICGEYAFYKE